MEVSSVVGTLASLTIAESEDQSQRTCQTLGKSGMLLLSKGLESLTHIDLSRSNIAELPDALNSIECVQSLHLSHNHLTVLPPSIRCLKDLKRLMVSFNQLSDLPPSFSELNALEVLDVSHNLLVDPPTCFQMGCIKISFLNISHNKLQEWNIGPLCAYGLKSLNCSHNTLRKNPHWIWTDFCRSLEDLDLSFNAFLSAASMVKTYTLWRTGVTIVLKNLNLTNCGLNSNEIHLLHQLKAIKNLHLGNGNERDIRFISERNTCSKENFLWNISFKSFQSARVLSELYLNRVGLAAVPEDISCLEALEILDCSQNHLQWLPDSISKLKKLKVAIFSKNKILYLPQDFGNFPALEELRLDKNQLGDLPPSCSELKTLRWLDLYDNRFEEFPVCLGAVLTNLSGLDLELNLFDITSCNVLCPKSVSLREAIREHLRANAEMVEYRANGQQIMQEDSYSSPEDQGSDLSCDNESLISHGSTHDYPETADIQSNHSEENWDLDDEADDYFDPTYMPSRIYRTLPRDAIFINELAIRPGSFCPSDIHPSPSIRSNKDPFASQDGQFDDA